MFLFLFDNSIKLIYHNIRIKWHFFIFRNLKSTYYILYYDVWNCVDNIIPETYNEECDFILIILIILSSK